jgi:hypothetical protein
MNGSAGSSRQKKQKQELTGSNGAVPASRTESGGPVVGLAVRIAEIIASQEAAHTVLLPAGRRLQLFYRRTLSAAEQVDAGLLLRVFLGCWFGTAASANGTLPARLPFRHLRSFASLLPL